MTVTADSTMIKVAGELDLWTADAAGARLHAAIGAGCGRARLDLGQLRFIDAHGLAVLLQAAAFACARGRQLEVVNVTAQVRKIMTVTGAGVALGIA
ncbi:STAS domain-containing protein [Catellatospora sp. NPDC049111]|uniref:STAS domain-containing protein n=1 Tax=Catellatospora sp. NPDC049111 TaxID=3155271 RepID=UPI00340850AE